MCTSLRHLKFLLVLSVAAAMLGVIGCSNSDPVTGPTSDVSQRPMPVYDVAADEFSELWVTVESMRFIGAGGGKSKKGEIDLDSVRVDLKALSSLSELYDIDSNGCKFTKLRLKVSDPEFVLDGDSALTEPDVKLLGNGWVELNFQGRVVVEPDPAAVLDVFFDLTDGLQIIRTGKGQYLLRPEIFVTQTEGPPEPPTTTADVIFEDAVITGVDLTSGIITVRTTDGSVVQVDTTQGAAISHLNGSNVLLDEIVVGWHVTVVGTQDTSTGLVTATTIDMIA
jgi:hypothetical protein